MAFCSLYTLTYRTCLCVFPFSIVGMSTEVCMVCKHRYTRMCVHHDYHHDAQDYVGFPWEDYHAVPLFPLLRRDHMPSNRRSFFASVSHYFVIVDNIFFFIIVFVLVIMLFHIVSNTSATINISPLHCHQKILMVEWGIIAIISITSS